MSRLTAKQRAFIDNYIKTLNGTEAARLAKYKGNDATLAAVAYENLRKPHLRQEIDRRFKELSITDDEILFRLQQQATADIGIAVDEHGRIDMEHLRERGMTAVIKKYKVTKTGREIEFYDAQSALVHLAKLRGMLVDRVKVEDWQSEIVDLLRNGRITPDDVRAAYPDLAAQFFAKAGVDADSG